MERLPDDRPDGYRITAGRPATGDRRTTTDDRRPIRNIRNIGSTGPRRAGAPTGDSIMRHTLIGPG
ncbi:hypothetical protein, partial [Streptomyces sp. NPDC058953]|uniref:hypothetical protein n=1 Tax=Streptomyces sp. NPDC058953 TaxID=3346676 RepID=UPI00368C9371